MNGELQKSRHGTANVFESFHKQLYTSSRDKNNLDNILKGRRVDDLEPIDGREVLKQLKLMKPGKAPDARGIVAEMLKAAGDGVRAVIEMDEP